METTIDDRGAGEQQLSIGDTDAPLYEIVRRIEQAFVAQDYVTTAQFLERDILAAWFGLSTERFGELVATLTREGTPVSDIVRVVSAMLFPQGDTTSGDEDASAAAGAAANPLMVGMRMFQLRMQGRPVEAMRQSSLSAGPIQVLFDANSGWMLFGALQSGITAMLAGDFSAAMARLTEAQMQVVVPSLVFLSRDAYVKMAMLQAAYGDVERARELLREADEMPRTESWAEGAIDADVAIASSMLPEVGPDEAIRLLDAVPLHDVGESWPFYVNALHCAFMAAGRLQDAEQRLAVFDRLELPRVDGQGFSGSVIPLAGAVRALARGDFSTARENLARADDTIPVTRIVAGLLETVAGRPREALQVVAGMHGDTRGFRQLELRRLGIMSAAHLTLGDREDCRDVLKYALEAFGGLTEHDRAFFRPDVEAFAREEVPGWPRGAREGRSHFDQFPEAGDVLTPREIDVLRELATGKSREQIARSQFISVNTLKGHLRSAYRKLGVTTRTSAVLEAERRGHV